MKLIIDIKDFDYKCCKENKVTLNLFEELIKAVSNGTIIDSKTCDSCRNQNSHHGVCDICHEHRLWTAKIDKSDVILSNKEYRELLSTDIVEDLIYDALLKCHIEPNHAYYVAHRILKENKETEANN